MVWRIYSEALNGDTTDISQFRLRLWKPVKFFDKTKFPNIRWVTDRFIGIDWETNDVFTLKVWSKTNGNWRKGR